MGRCRHELVDLIGEAGGDREPAQRYLDGLLVGLDQPRATKRAELREWVDRAAGDVAGARAALQNLQRQHGGRAVDELTRVGGDVPTAASQDSYSRRVRRGRVGPPEWPALCV